jgi:hypothetical protein
MPYGLFTSLRHTGAMWKPVRDQTRKPGRGRALLLLAGLGAALLASYGFGRIAHPTPYNPVLQGPRPGPCNPHRGSADLTPGVDVYGYPVAPADAPASNRNAPDVRGIIVKVKRPGGNDAYVDVAGMNVPPTCPAARRSR